MVLNCLKMVLTCFKMVLTCFKMGLTCFKMVFKLISWFKIIVVYGELIEMKDFPKLDFN